MTKLIRVARAEQRSVFFSESRYGVIALQGLQNLDVEEENYRRLGEFFIVDDKEYAAIVALLAKENPGLEVQVYDMIEVSTCPPGEIVTKKVSKDGVLPNLSKKVPAQAEAVGVAQAAPQNPAAEVAIAGNRIAGGFFQDIEAQQQWPAVVGLGLNRNRPR